MQSNSILTETENGTYYTGPLAPAIKAMRDEYGDSITVHHNRDTGKWIIEERRGAHENDDPNQWGIASTEDEAWRYLIGADFGPLDATYEDEGYEAVQRKMLGLTWTETYEDYLSDEPEQHGIPDGLTREQWQAYVDTHL